MSNSAAIMLLRAFPAIAAAHFCQFLRATSALRIESDFVNTFRLFLQSLDKVESRPAELLLVSDVKDANPTARKSAAAAATAAAAQRAGGGTRSQEHPEFMLPYAMHLLAHHPDCPSPEVFLPRTTRLPL